MDEILPSSVDNIAGQMIEAVGTTKGIQQPTPIVGSETSMIEDVETFLADVVTQVAR